MKSKSLFRLLCILCTSAVLQWTTSVTAEDCIQLRTAIHIASEVSEGNASLEQIIQTARNNNIDAVVVTDRHLMKWEYGLWPLRNVIKKTVEHRSVSTYGFQRYLSLVRTVDQNYPDVILLPGVEAAPFYYWEGSPFKKHLTMKGWHKHLMVTGMNKAEDYSELPVIGASNTASHRLSPLSLWPLLTLAGGTWLAATRKRSTSSRTTIYLTSTVVVLLSFIFLVNNRPFTRPEFDQYMGDMRSIPYQRFIDYVDNRGGITFWAHLEAVNCSEKGSISFETGDHCHELIDTTGYTGFAVFYEGRKRAGKPSGTWDSVLREYCYGLRRKPAWIISGLASEDLVDLPVRMKEMQTVLLVKKRLRQDVLDAMKKGRSYVVRGRRSMDFVLEEFTVSDEADENSRKGIAGDTVMVEGRPLLNVSGTARGMPIGVEIRIIRDGTAIDSIRAETPFELSLPQEPVSGSTTYFRLEVVSPDIMVLTNPIFVTGRVTTQRGP